MYIESSHSRAAAVLAAALVFTSCQDSGPSRSRPECDGKCDGTNTPVYKSPWGLDPESLNEMWPDPQYPIEKIQDLGTMKVQLGPLKVKSATNYYGEPMYVMPYADRDGGLMADGTPVPRRDSEIAKVFPVGEVGIAIKHHRAKHRSFGDADLAGDLKEHFKLQATHIEIPVGVMRDGAPGAITINNPQDYQDGLFGDPDYPMDFMRIEYPSYVDPDLRTKFMNNLRAHLMNYAAVSNFPRNYNGGDPLAAWNPEKILEHSVMAVKAIAGDDDALKWFKDEEHLIYCAELAHVATSSSIIVPLTKEFMVPLLGENGTAVWDAYVVEVEELNSGNRSNAFSRLNENDKADLIRLDIDALEGLQPLWTYAPVEDQAAAQRALAFQPLTAADIVSNFLGLIVPRAQLGESVAPAQGALLGKMKPGLLESMGLDRVSETDPRRVAVDQLFNALVSVVGTSYSSYHEFQTNLAPLMNKARQLTGPRTPDALSAGDGYFMPPSGFQVIALGRHPGGLLRLRYAGTGVHWSMVRPGVNTTEDPSTSPDPTVDIDMTASCAAPERCGNVAPSGCKCDQACEWYGDCCWDYEPAFCGHRPLVTPGL